MMRPLVSGLAACSDPGPWHASHTGIVGSERLATCRPRACRVCVKCSTSSLWQAMQVFSPTARASGAPGFNATCAFAKPGAGRGRSLRATGPSQERFVDGSDLAASSDEARDWPTAHVQARNTAPRLAAVDKLSRPRIMPFPRVSQFRHPTNGAPNCRLIAPNRAECAHPFFVYEAHQPAADTTFPA